MYFDIEHHHSGPFLFGRWHVYLCNAHGFPVAMNFAVTRRAAERKGRRMLAREVQR